MKCSDKLFIIDKDLPGMLRVWRRRWIDLRADRILGDKYPCDKYIHNINLLWEDILRKGFIMKI